MQGPKGRRQRPEGPKSRPNAEAGLGSGEGHWVPPHQLRSLGSAVNSPSRVRGGAGTAQWFFTVLGTGKCLSWTKKCDWAFVNWQYSATNRTLHCPAWAENYVGHTQKTGQSGEKPDTWQPSIVRRTQHVGSESPESSITRGCLGSRRDVGFRSRASADHWRWCIMSSRVTYVVFIRPTSLLTVCCEYVVVAIRPSCCWCSCRTLIIASLDTSLDVKDSAIKTHSS